MSQESPSELLLRVTQGDSHAFDRLFGIVYSDLRGIAHRQLLGNVLAGEISSTDLVHEAYARLIDSDHQNLRGRTHFIALGAKVMRQILVDRARYNLAQKRGGGAKRVDLDTGQLSRGEDEHVLQVDEALTRLARIDRLQARIVELRFFGGLTVSEVAQQLGKSKRWVEGEWTMIRAWLRAELSEA